MCIYASIYTCVYTFVLHLLTFSRENISSSQHCAAPHAASAREASLALNDVKLWDGINMGMMIIIIIMIIVIIYNNNNKNNHHNNHNNNHHHHHNHNRD